MTTLNATTLSEYDFSVLVDVSGSMGETDMPGGKSRYDYMQETVLSFTRDIEKIDSDGIDLVFFGGSNIQTFPGVTSSKVKETFAQRSPRGSTPLAGALTAALDIAGTSSKKNFVLVFTDGVPDDQAAAAKVIIDASNKLTNDEDLTFLFVQVGNDASATKYLTSLDDSLTSAKFDIVDTKTMAQAEAFASTVDLVVAAIND